MQTSRRTRQSSAKAHLVKVELLLARRLLVLLALGGALVGDDLVDRNLVTVSGLCALQ